MTPLAALALAVRDRLTAGAEAPLPGIGTLACAHVSARVRVGPDGQRVMLPPGEAVGLLARAGDPTDLAQAVARHAEAAPASAASALRTAVDQLDARLAITGDARLDGVGVFQRTSSGIRFAAAPELLAAVNRPYEGLTPVPLGPTETPAETPPALVPPPSPAAEPPPDSPPGAVDILLDLIVNEPPEADAPAGPVAAGVPTAAAPSQSTFADDPPPDAGTPPPDAEAEKDEPGVAVPFGTDGETLRDRLPPTPDGPEPAPPTDFGDEPFPLDPPVPDEAGPVDEERTDPVGVETTGPDDAAEPDEASDLATLPDLELAAFDASAAAGSAPPRTSEPHMPSGPTAGIDEVAPDEVAPDARPDDVDTAAADAMERRATRRGWAVLAAATVLALSALVLYWFLTERRPPVAIPAAAPIRPTVRADSARPSSRAPDTLVAAPDSSAPADGRP